MPKTNTKLIDNSAQSVLAGATASLRRLTCPAVAPTLVTQGYACSNFSQLRFLLKAKTAGTVDFSIYWWDLIAELWILDTTIGTAGVANVASGSVLGPVLATGAAGFVCVVAVLNGGAAADVWAGGNQ